VKRALGGNLAGVVAWRRERSAEGGEQPGVLVGRPLLEGIT
jgi:hypothetical protein